MFAVLIEAEPREEQLQAYLAKANMLGPELEQAPGFAENIRYRSLTRDRWILSLSAWRDEASVIGWHERMRGDEAGENGWNQLLADYRLRIGEVTSDTRVPDAPKIGQLQLDETDAAGGIYVTLIDAKQTPEWVTSNNPQEIALYLGFDLYSYGDCISWDIFDSVSDPGEIILLVTWKDAESANDHAATQIVPDGARVRVVRIVRVQAMSDRDDASQDHRAAGHETIQA
jgi:heme-degrading monooxygenase HmoA